jgi:hypothetical protein
VVGRNLYTFSDYSGLDPEVGCGVSSNAGACGGTVNRSGGDLNQGTGSGLINQVDAFGFPTLRTFTFTLTTRF